MQCRDQHKIEGMTKTSSNASSKPVDRKMIEKKRRIHMKTLCFKLVSLVPSHHFKPSKDMLSQQDQLDQAASYIKQLAQRIEDLKRKRKELSSNLDTLMSSNNNTKLPLVELRELGSSLQLVVITGLHKKFMVCEVVSVLEEEGAEVVGASFCTVGDKVFHTFHAKVKISRVGVETARVCERLQDLIC